MRTADDIGRLKQEAIETIVFHASPSTVHAQAVDNRVGAVMLRLPVGAVEPTRRLEHVVARTRRAEPAQRPVPVVDPMARLASTPLGRSYTAPQRASNLITTNVIDPDESVYVLGARVLMILPIIELIGNIGLTLRAFSYAGELSLVVTADAAASPTSTSSWRPGARVARTGSGLRGRTIGTRPSRTRLVDVERT